MFFQIMEVLKSVIDTIKYVYCWCSDIAEMCLLFYAENWWGIESDFNSTVDVSKTSAYKPKKAGTVDKCPFWVSLRNKSESDACGNICCGFKQSVCMEAMDSGSELLGVTPEWDEALWSQRNWLSALPLDQTLLGVCSMLVAIFLEGKYFYWESDIFSNTLDDW